MVGYDANSSMTLQILCLHEGREAAEKLMS